MSYFRPTFKIKHNSKQYSQSTKVSLFLVFFASWLTIPSTFAQQIENECSISGRVVDNQAKAIDYATVALKNAVDSTVVKVATTNDNGDFVFKSIKYGNYVVVVQSIGYSLLKTDKVVLSQSNANINLGSLQLFASKTTELKQVTVTSQLPFIERSSGRTTVNLQNSILSEGASMLEVMQKLPGMLMGSDGQIALNGNTGVNVYVDGRPTRLSGQELSNYLTGLSSSNIQKVEIISKPSARYEAAGSGGIINIVRKKNKKDGFNGNINNSYTQGLYSKYNTGGTANFKKNLINLSVSENYSFNKGFRNSEAVTNFLDNGLLSSTLISDNKHVRTYKTHTPYVGIDLNLSSKSTLILSGSGEFQTLSNQSNSKSDLTGRYNENIFYNFLNTSKDILSNYTTNAHFEHRIDTLGQELSFDFDYLKYGTDATQDIFNTQTQAGLNDINNNIWLIQNRELSVYSGKVDYTLPLKKKFTIEAGFKLSRVSSGTDSKYFNIISSGRVYDPTLSNNFNYIETINAGYATVKKTINNLQVELGLRAENTNGKGEEVITNNVVKREYFNLFPSAFLTYNANKNNKFHYNFTRRIDRPGYSSLNPLRRFINTTSYVQGNAFLLPKLSYSSEIGYSYKNKLFVTINYTRSTNPTTSWIFTDIDKAVTVSQPINIERSTALNFDLSYSKKVKSYWSTNNSFNIYYPTFTGSVGGYALTNPKSPAFYLNSNNTLTINKKLSAEIGSLYIHKYNNGAYTYDPTYNLSFGVKRTLFNNKGSISANVNDALQLLLYNSHIKTLTIDDKWNIKNVTRTVKLSFSYRFGNTKSKSVKKVSGADDEKKRSSSN